MAPLLCTVCQAERATVYCRADDAHLCAGCDESIHKANRMSRRHKRHQLDDSRSTTASTRSNSESHMQDDSASPSSQTPDREQEDSHLRQIADACVKREAAHLAMRTGYTVDVSSSRSELRGSDGSSRAMCTEVRDGRSSAKTRAQSEEADRAAERQKALLRFREKKANRSFQKKVRYEFRKQLADSRPRDKGRFVGKQKEDDIQW